MLDSKNVVEKRYVMLLGNPPMTSVNVRKSGFRMKTATCSPDCETSKNKSSSVRKGEDWKEDTFLL